jgi:hypothetical protein
MFTNGITANAQTNWQTLPPVFYAERTDVDYCCFRTVLIGDEDFDFRVYDYKGGFYICAQIAIADKEEHERQEAFDRLKRQAVYLMHYIPIGRANPNSWEIQQYQVHYLKLPSLNSLDAIDFETIVNHPDWETNYKLDLDVVGSRMPDYLLPWNQLSQYAQESWSVKTKQPWREKSDDVAYEGHRFDMRLINELKEQGQYDTIVKTDSSTLYINTDYVSYEIADDPAIFFVEERKYYPDGMLKSKKCFIAGVYTSESMLVGPCVFYDEKGELTDGTYPEIEQSMFPEYLSPNFPTTLSLEYLLRFLEKRNYIDSKTGKGKPVMTINAYIDPHAPSHGTPRLSIRSNWQIQTDDEPNGSVALLIKKDDETETVYLFSKNSKMIWDRFDR